jgi:hypothetical protein
MATSSSASSRPERSTILEAPTTGENSAAAAQRPVIAGKRKRGKYKRYLRDPTAKIPRMTLWNRKKKAKHSCARATEKYVNTYRITSK